MLYLQTAISELPMIAKSCLPAHKCNVRADSLSEFFFRASKNVVTRGNKNYLSSF